jgi:hypothetical protein
MSVKTLRRAAVTVLIAGALLLPQSAAAQSVDGSDPVDDATPVDDSTPVVVDETTPVEFREAPAVESAPNWQTNAIYLERLQSVRSGWFRLETGVDNIARQQRLGALPPSVGQVASQAYPGAVDVLEQVLLGSTPPPQFGHVHQLHLSAAAEFRAAMNAAEVSRSTGDQGALREAQTHFGRFDRLIGQALVELG